MKGIKIGHCNTEHTGVTVIIADGGAVGGVDVRGGAPGTRETDLLASHNTVERINAVVLCGGSAFGLSAADGVMRYLHSQGAGFDTGAHKVPIVAGAVLYDLQPDKLRYPDSDMGFGAAECAVEDNQEWGSVGAGKGATVGKVLGPMGVSKGGIGFGTVKTANAEVSAVVAVNAFGHVYDMTTGSIIAGAKMPDGTMLDTEQFLLTQDILALKSAAMKGGVNTTIGTVVTNAVLTKPQANKLATVAHNGLAMSIKPVHTTLDGDTLFVMGTCEVNEDFDVLCMAAAEAVRRAVINAVTGEGKNQQ